MLNTFPNSVKIILVPSSGLLYGLYTTFTTAVTCLLRPVGPKPANLIGSKRMGIELVWLEDLYRIVLDMVSNFGDLNEADSGSSLYGANV